MAYVVPLIRYFIGYKKVNDATPSLTGDVMARHAFSLYDIEEFLRDAGAEKVNERAVISFEEELENTLNDLLNEAEKYANYAGRRNLIKRGDVKLLNNGNATKRYPRIRGQRTPATLRARARTTNPASTTHI